ncbi:hypothetical protein BJ875DRAFT_365264 [Amylocarpus encephaloides]|uniref:YCII-related domain-containing protein n=1 Tax=Amylocarpus encephaloides TaxID=45428 RepID=A0A9P8CA75_9HELO|nr:hypothetical protein BJ875DRAFT_365264 [Amylocarpus encephaloides]
MSATRTLSHPSLAQRFRYPFRAILRAGSVVNQARKMTAIVTPPGQFEWLVVIPDFEGKLEKRMEVRPKHFEGLKTGLEEGVWKMGGAFLEEVPKEGEGMKMKGSAMICLASSKEEVLEKLKNDVYTQTGVWDLNKLQIYPFKCAFRNP